MPLIMSLRLSVRTLVASGYSTMFCRGSLTSITMTPASSISVPITLTKNAEISKASCLLVSSFYSSAKVVSFVRKLGSILPVKVYNVLRSSLMS